MNTRRRPIAIRRAWTPATCIHVWVEPDSGGNLACTDCCAIRTDTGWSGPNIARWEDS